MKWWKELPWSDEHARPDLDGDMPPGPGHHDKPARIDCTCADCMTRPPAPHPGYYRAAASDPDGTQDEYCAASCGDPECPEEHGDEDDQAAWEARVLAAQKTLYEGLTGEPFVPLAPWGGPAPQPKLASRRGLARAWAVRAVIVVLAVVLVLLLGWVR
jgi:hypothetical protein